MEALATNPTQILNKIGDLKPLSAKHEQFLALILVGESQGAAYRQVYSCDLRTADVSASRLLKNPNFLEHLKLRRQALADSNDINHEWVIRNLKEIVEECRRQGKGYNPSVATKAIELIGKHLGTFEKEQRETDDVPQWTGIEIDYGEGVVKVVTGTGPAVPLEKTKD